VIVGCNTEGYYLYKGKELSNYFCSLSCQTNQDKKNTKKIRKKNHDMFSYQKGVLFLQRKGII
jgi:hypothetical protein